MKARKTWKNLNTSFSFAGVNVGFITALMRFHLALEVFIKFVSLPVFLKGASLKT